MWLADLIAGIVVLLLGIGVLFFSWQLPYKAEYGPGPGFLPLWIGLGIVGCAVAIIINILKKREKTEPFFKPRTKMGVRVIIEIVITFLLTPLTGFSVGLGLFVGATMRTIGKHRWISCGLTAALTAVCIHFIFGYWLNIPLPTGLVGW